MSHQFMIPSDPISSSKGPNANSYELLLSDLRKEPSNLSPKQILPRYSKINTTWRTYWKTPAAMAALYALAWIIAMTHLAVFISLNQERTDVSVPQNYVAALSHVLGLFFRASLCGSLTIAFTQYLWRIVRLKTIEVSSIDRLFKINQDPLLLALPDVVRTAPVLFVLALFTWLLPIAVTFPPGALIVIPKATQSTSPMTVPTYNGSYLGNNSQADAQLKSLAVRHVSGGEWLYISATPYIKRIGRLVLELDNVVPTPSPCGPDCAYSILFEGPYLQCTENVFNQTSLPIGTLNCGENAFFASNVSTFGGEGIYYNVGDAFNMSTSRSITSITQKDSPDFGHIRQEIGSISCVPSRATYNVDVVYSGGLQTIKRSQKYTSSIRDMIPASYDYSPATPQCEHFLHDNDSSAYDTCIEYTPATWPPDLTQVLTALNHFSLIDAMVNPLTGNYTMMQDGSFAEGADEYVSCGATSGSLVADTRLNVQRENVSRAVSDGPSFVVSEDILNDVLFNITMSAALQFNLWQTTVPVNVTNIHQVYSFASPRTLLIPYLTCLVLSIPFLYLGLISLRLNGVSAMQGGFLQLLMTTTGSSTLGNAAAGGCLGGDENVPENLKRMKIRFGEFASSSGDLENDGRFGRRTGFGTDNELVPLERNTTYVA